MPKNPKKPYIANHYIMTEFDWFLDDVSNKRSMEFSEEAKKNGRAEIKHFRSVYEYAMWKDFNDLATEPLEQLVGAT